MKIKDKAIDQHNEETYYDEKRGKIILSEEIKETFKECEFNRNKSWCPNIHKILNPDTYMDWGINKKNNI